MADLSALGAFERCRPPTIFDRIQFVFVACSVHAQSSAVSRYLGGRVFPNFTIRRFSGGPLC